MSRILKRIAAGVVIAGVAALLLAGLLLPAMLATSFGAQGLQGFLRRRGLKLLIALLLIASGAWTLYITALHGNHASHARSGNGAPMDHSKMHH